MLWWSFFFAAKRRSDGVKPAVDLCGPQQRAMSWTGHAGLPRAAFCHKFLELPSVSHLAIRAALPW